jgi:hypothetical protein
MSYFIGLSKENQKSLFNHIRLVDQKPIYVTRVYLRQFEAKTIFRIFFKKPFSDLLATKTKPENSIHPPIHCAYLLYR